MRTWQEHDAKARAIRNSPMVKAWIVAYQTDKWNTHGDCRNCGYPHSPNTICGMGSSFGILWLGRDHYSVDFSNVVFFHDFMLNLGKDWGFHWRNETYFKRAKDGTVEVHYIEQFNNSPQIKTWHIPANEWASIVASVSAIGETNKSYHKALNFHEIGKAE